MEEKFELQTARGVRDIPPEEMILREKITEKLKKVFIRYGFNPLETPIIEKMDVLSVKFGAGADSDAMKEIFQFKDQGKRNLGLRFELTLSMCRYIAMNPNTKMPFKRYEIGRVYRDGPIKLGRTREFYQCDVDIVGSNNIMADAEIIKLALDVFKELCMDAYLEVNSRKLLNGILEDAGISKDNRMASIIIIDKLNKIGAEGVKEELKGLGIPVPSIKKIMSYFENKGDFKDILNDLKKTVESEIGKEGIKDLEDLFSLINEKEQKNVILNTTLARGLSYYTGIVFEGFLRKSKITSSICGGGRYDEMISLLLQSKNKIPATGISFGLVPIMEAFKLGSETQEKTLTKVYVIPIGNTKKHAMEILGKIRDNEINADIDLVGRGISKNLNYANSMAIPFVIFAGEKEIAEKKLKIRDMTSGEEKTLDIDEAIAFLKLRD